MRYLCLGYHDEKTWQAVPERERETLLEDTAAYLDYLRANGHVVDHQALQNAAAATTLRFRGGKALITDGPFAETKEQLGGILVLEANDLNHAAALVSKMPCMRMDGSIEIRPFNEELSDQLNSRSAAAAT